MMLLWQKHANRVGWLTAADRPIGGRRGLRPLSSYSRSTALKGPSF